MGTSNHRGYANLEINGNSMEGNYFNDPSNNKNWGKLNLKKLLNHKCIVEVHLIIQNELLKLQSNVTLLDI